MATGAGEGSGSTNGVGHGTDSGSTSSSSNTATPAPAMAMSTLPPPPTRVAAPGNGTASAYGDAQGQPQLYAAPSQPAGRLEYEAYAALARRTLGSLSDRARQAVLDVISGGVAGGGAAAISSPDPVLEQINLDLWERRDEYSTKRDVTILTGTYNVNAKAPGESLLPWVLPETLPNEPDIIALAFQEVVPLTPSQILLTDPSRLWVWENAIMDAINRRPSKQADYAYVRSEQLVGTALLILVKTSLLHNVRQVEAATKKTGLRGMSGNKGGVAIRLKVFDSTICFVTAHLAAGQTSVEQRNDDYRTISNGLIFPQGGPISTHDHVIWFGDFNYRIDIANERARWLAENDDYSALMAKDQLKRAQDAQLAFVGFTEGQLGFRPTYKYDNGTSTYDTSEKQRIPAWTDRILYRGHGLRQLVYNRAELLTSDHRPVYAFFEAELRIFDQKRRKEVLSEIMSRRRSIPERGLAVALGREMSSSGSDEGDLPDPSSDSYSWWDTSDPDSDSDRCSSDSDDEPVANPFVHECKSDSTGPSSASNGANVAAASSLPTRTACSAVVGTQRRAMPPPLPGRSTRESSPQTPGSGPSNETPPVQNSAASAPTQAKASSPSAQRRAPPPIPRKPSLSTLRMPSTGPASAAATSAPSTARTSLPGAVGESGPGRPGEVGNAEGRLPRRPVMVRSKSATSTRSILTDSE